LVARSLVKNGAFDGVLLEYPVWLSKKEILRLMAVRKSRSVVRTVPLRTVRESKRSAIAHYRSQKPGWEGLPVYGALSDAFVEKFISQDEIFFGEAQSV
jgi:hypothetical protein